MINFFNIFNYFFLGHITRYYTGYPKDLGPLRVIHFTSERQFVQLLHEGRPVVVAFTIKSVLSMVWLEHDHNDLMSLFLT